MFIRTGGGGGGGGFIAINSKIDLILTQSKIFKNSIFILAVCVRIYLILVLCDH